MNLMTPFDPYYKWLGIPADQQPASHYRLLGVQEFEIDADVIDSAAQQRTVYLRSFQAGPNAELAERLLNEISAARVCLLDGKSKALYDTQLRTAQQAVTEEESLPFMTDELAAISSKPSTQSQSRSGKPIWKEPWAIPAAAGVVVLFLLMTWLFSSGEESKDPGNQVTNTTPSSQQMTVPITNNEAAPDKVAIAPPPVAPFDTAQEQKSVIVAGAEEQKRIVQDLLQNGVEVEIRVPDGNRRRLRKQAPGSSKLAPLPATFEVESIHHGGRPMSLLTAKQIASLDTVRTLQIWDCGLGREHLQYLLLLPQIESINLDANDLSGKDMEGLVLTAFYVYLSNNPRLKLSDIFEVQAPRMHSLRLCDFAIRSVEELIQLEGQFLQLTNLGVTPDTVSPECISNLHQTKRISTLGLRVTEPFNYGTDEKGLQRAVLWHERARAIVRSEFFQTRLRRLELLDVSEDSMDDVVAVLESLDAAPASTSLEELVCQVWVDAVTDKDLLEKYQQVLSRVRQKYPQLKVEDEGLEPLAQKDL